MALPARGAVYRFGNFVLDPENEALRTNEGVSISLRPKSFALLRLMVENAGRLLARETIMETLWPNIFVTDDISPSAFKTSAAPSVTTGTICYEPFSAAVTSSRREACGKSPGPSPPLIWASRPPRTSPTSSACSDSTQRGSRRFPSQNYRNQRRARQMPR